MPFHFPLSKATVINRPYGFAHLITKDEASFKNIRALVITIKPRQHTSRHHHPVEEFFFILEGNALFRGADKEFRIKERDVILVSPNEVHEIWNDNPQNPLVYLVGMSPPNDSSKIFDVEK